MSDSKWGDTDQLNDELDQLAEDGKLLGMDLPPKASVRPANIAKLA